MNLDISWTTPININEENATPMILHEPLKYSGSISLDTVNYHTKISDDSERLDRNLYVSYICIYQPFLEYIFSGFV